jgi:VCBS repeat-containing protein
MSKVISSTSSQHPGSGLRYARYVGRIGALAVSLGVGLAVATTPGVARADGPTDDSAGTANTSTSTTSTTSTSETAKSAVQSRQERRRALRAIVGAPRHSFGVPRGDEKPGPSDDSDGQTNTGAGNESDGAADAGPLTGVRATTIKRSSNDAVKQLVSARQILADPPARRSAPAASPTARVQTRVERVTRAPALSSITTRSAAVQDRLRTATRAYAPVGQSAPAPIPAPTPAAPTVASAPATFVTGVLTAIGLAPSLTPGRTPAPAPAPFAWAVLGFVRRELEHVQRTFFNRTPNARDDAVSTSEDVAIENFNPLTNDTDDDPLQITGVTDGTYGKVTTNGATVTYTPNAKAQALKAGQTVTDTFTYTVSDENSAPHLHGIFGFFSRGHSDTATVTVTLTGVNDAPVAVEDKPVISEDAGSTVVDVLANDTDVDGDALKVTAVTGAPTLGAIAVADGVVTYTPNAEAQKLGAGKTATDSFTYTVSDGNGGAATGTVTVTVVGANDAPTAGADTLAIAENAGAQTINVLANDKDVDGDALMVTGVTQGTNPLGAVGFTGSTVTYTPNAAALALNAGEVGTDSFTYTVSDGNGGTATGTVTVTVTGVSDTTVVSTGTHTPVEIVLGPDGNSGIIRNADGTFSEIDYDPDRGWVVGAGYDAGIDAGAFDLDGRLAYAYGNQDGSLMLIDRESGAVIGRATDSLGVTYRFDDVTDVAVDHRVDADTPQVDVAYVVERDGRLSEVDTRTGRVVRSVDTRARATEATTLMAADAAVVSAPSKLAVAKGGTTVYVASGNRIAVVKRQTVAAARVAGDAVAADGGDLVYDESLDLNLDEGSEITAIEASADGTRLYATVASVDASGRAVSRLQTINVAADGTLTRAGSVEVGSGARSLAINDQLNRAYVVSDRDVSVVGLGNLDVIRRVDAGAVGGVVAVAPQRDTVLVTNPDAHAVSVVTDSPITIELDWGATPRDLDAHLIGPSATTPGQTFHVYYANPEYEVGTQTAAFLNVDDRDGNGPEVIQIDTRTPGTYLFYVHNFSGEANFTGTTVRVRDVRSGIDTSYSQPSGTGRYWHVFKITVSDSGAVTVSQQDLNTIDNDDPTTAVVEGGANIAT